MSLKSINESFKRLYESEENFIQEDEYSDLELTLRNTVDSLIDNNEFHIKKFEIALQSVLEDYFPEQSWWEVTNINIFMDLFENRDPYGTVERILQDLRGTDDEVEESLNEARNMDNVEINNKIAKALSRKSFARKYEKELNDLGITVEFLDGQGTMLIGPNGKKLSSSRKEIYGPSAPGFNGTHYKGYIHSPKYAQRAYDRTIYKLDSIQNLINSMDVTELSRNYPNMSVEDATAALQRDFESTKADAEKALEYLKKEQKDYERSLSSRHQSRQLGHEQSYIRDTAVEDSVDNSPIDYLTYLTKDISELRKPVDTYSDEYGDYTPRINKYYNLEKKIKRAESDLSFDKRYHKVLEPDELQNKIDELEDEFNRKVASLLKDQEYNKSSIQKSYDNVDNARKAKDDYMKSLGIGN